MAPHSNHTQMNAQSPNSIPSWKCTGTSTNSHAEVINNNDKCQYCDKIYTDYRAGNRIVIGQRILLSTSGIAAILALCLVVSAIVSALAQSKNELQQRDQQVIEGSKCLRLMGEINNVIWQGATLNANAVIGIQKQLKSLGFYEGEIDGTFAQITRKAMKDFQQDCKARLD
jgi:hypothetical protein